MYLITKWFGVFLFKENQEIKQKILFPKKSTEIKKRLDKINNGEILKEEKQLIEKYDSLIVCEKRLEKYGDFYPYDNFFEELVLDSYEFGFDESLLYKACISTFEDKMTEKLHEDDLQVIQMVDALDDLKQTCNLLLERIDACEEISFDKEKISPLTQSFKAVEKETKSLEEKIKNEMKKIAPNISSIAGPLIAARLLSQAGSLKKLAFLPASTIQVLGAEKALFRFKKEGGKPPKHGVIFQNPNINRAPRDKRGKIARVLASKISIAAKADAFTKNQVSDKLEKEFKERKKEIL